MRDRVTHKPVQTILAFDYGTKRIGIAIGDARLQTAHPLTTIESEKNEQRFAVIKSLIEQWQPDLLIVGLPVYMDGQEHELTERAHRFARQLTGRFALPVELIDERLTSVAADEMLRESGLAARKYKTKRDQIAAQLILQNYYQHVSA